MEGLEVTERCFLSEFLEGLVVFFHLLLNCFQDFPGEEGMLAIAIDVVGGKFEISDIEGALITCQGQIQRFAQRCFPVIDVPAYGVNGLTFVFQGVSLLRQSKSNRPEPITSFDVITQSAKQCPEGRVQEYRPRRIPIADSSLDLLAEQMSKKVGTADINDADHGHQDLHYGKLEGVRHLGEIDQRFDFFPCQR